MRQLIGFILIIILWYCIMCWPLPLNSPSRRYWKFRKSGETVYTHDIYSWQNLREAYPGPGILNKFLGWWYRHLG